MLPLKKLIMKLNYFKELPFIEALKSFYESLAIPVNYVTNDPTSAKEILEHTFKDNSTFNLIEDVYFVGMVDDAAFEGSESINKEDIKKDYDGVLVFGITLKKRKNSLLPTRSQLAEISRAFNREFYYTPVTIVFKYNDDITNYLAFANTERLTYKQEWREGEKAGKVSLLRDINLETPHRGHEDILSQLAIPRKGKKAVNSFDALYKHWQEVFSVSLLNKRFYQELQYWYFWAIKEVKFPNQPNEFDFGDRAKYVEAVNEHKATNVIRLLTRLLFIWFIKEKGLVPKELFDFDYVNKNLVDKLYGQKEKSSFALGEHNSKYYRAILQNLFFGALNQEQGKREFRKAKQHQNVTNLMRYHSYFVKGGAEKFIELLEAQVPFLNGGLFDCLDKPHPTQKGKQGGAIIIYQDGFSDREDNRLEVPDFLFFDVDEEVDVSDEMGSKKAVYKKAKTRGLFEILNAYKFTITENTPIEEDVALDPELLGKVFENLLASYNPETKTTARKQTGSFYTPREIVNYMVDESLIAYLKNKVQNWQGLNDEEVDKTLHQLTSFDTGNPFESNPELSKEIVTHLSTCTILDPACGSGAFPMGILQKMVHILQKLDPDNSIWKTTQLEKASNESAKAFEVEDQKERDELEREIEESFNENINNPDYARKLYLIENCIYGVDIQPIATQISKLRFFISLVVEQKINPEHNNFGIRPLPNLETKFVTANTLIGLEKPKEFENLFDDQIIHQKINELKTVRHKLFGAKTKKTKNKYKTQDENLRKEVRQIVLEKLNQKTEEYKRNHKLNKELEYHKEVDNEAKVKKLQKQLNELEAQLHSNNEQLADSLALWDPYDQNASSNFFDPEWMFDISEGFDVVIGNPPYHQLSKDKSAQPIYKEYLKNKYQTSAGRLNLFIFFTHEAINLAEGSNGIVSYIIPNTILTQDYYSDTRKKILKDTRLIKLVDYDDMPFENAVVENVTFVLSNTRLSGNKVEVIQDDLIKRQIIGQIDQDKFLKQRNFSFNIHSNEVIDTILSNRKHRKLSILCDVNQGIALKGDKSLSLRNGNPNGEYYRLLDGRNINKYKIEWDGVFLDYDLERIHSCKRKDIFKSDEKLFFRRVSKNLIFTYDNSQFFALNTLIVVNKKNNCKDSLKALLAIFNSEILNYIYQKQFKSTKKVFSEIQARSVKELPIPIIPANVDSLLALLSDILMIKQGNSEIFNSVSNALVDELYFPDYMKEREIDVLEFVERDIEKALQSREFDSLDDAEKEKVIEQLYATWSHTDNEVVKRMSQFKEKSPDILKPILES